MTLGMWFSFAGRVSDSAGSLQRSSDKGRACQQRVARQQNFLSSIGRTAAAPCTSSRFRASLAPYSDIKLRKRDREDEMPVSWAKCLGALALTAAAVTTTAAV